MPAKCLDGKLDYAVGNAVTLTRQTSITIGDNPTAESDALRFAEQVIRGAEELTAEIHPLLPRFVRMLDSDYAEAAEILSLLDGHSALAGRLIAAANCAFYAMPRTVSSVADAIETLGTKTVLLLAIASCTAQLYRYESDHAGRYGAELWRHSIDTALVSVVIAKHLYVTDRADIDAGEVFTAALLHDIGKLALEAGSSQSYFAAMRVVERRGLQLVDVEDKMLPCSHAGAGAALAEFWRLPAPIIDAIQYHHDVELAHRNEAAVAVVALANELTGYLGDIADSPDHIAELAPALHGPACELLGLRTDELAPLILASCAEIDNSAPLRNCL